MSQLSNTGQNLLLQQCGHFQLGNLCKKVASTSWKLAFTHQQVGLVALKLWCFNRNE